MISRVNITVPAGSKSVKLTAGQTFDPKGIPASSLSSMLRLNQCCEDGDFEQEEVLDDPLASDPVKSQTTTDWKATPIQNLGLDAPAVEALNTANLILVSDVLAFGSANGSLTGISGIGEATEKKIQEAITELSLN